MTSNTISSKVQIDKAVLKTLLTEVKETVAQNLVITPKKKTFTALDMWNIRRNARQVNAG